MVAASVGSLPANNSDWPIFIGGLVPTPDEQIAITDSGGFTPNPRWILNYRSLQVLIRGKEWDYNTAYQKAEAIQDVLLGLTPQTVGTDWWDGITGLGDINFIAYDDKERPVFSLNLRIILERADNVLTNRDPL